jgi:prepilin-type N-terminal cleavage/methylation domain-containing protein
MSKGFTLIELLLVVAIIGILSGVMLTLINPLKIQQKSRDSRRLQDLESLVNALTLAVSEDQIEFYDTSTACGVDGCVQTEGGIAVDGTGYVKFTVTGTMGFAEYSQVLPLDPLASSSYVFASDGSDYEINAVLEHEDNLQKMTIDGGNSDNIYEVGTSLSIL